MGGIYLGQLAARIGCDHLPPTSTLHGGSAVQGQGGGSPMWSVAVYCMHRLWGFPGDADQGQPHLCSAATCAGLGDSHQSQAVHLG